MLAWRESALHAEGLQGVGVLSEERLAGRRRQLLGADLCPKRVEYFGHAQLGGREHLERALMGDVPKTGWKWGQRAPGLEPGRLVDADLERDLERVRESPWRVDEDPESPEQLGEGDLGYSVLELPEPAVKSGLGLSSIRISPMAPARIMG